MLERYHSVNGFLREKFSGQKTVKIPVDAHFNCPNKDGTLSDRGCVFCDSYGSGPVHPQGISIRQQIESFIRKHPKRKYIVYYQAHTNTYASLSELEKKFSIVLSYEDVVGLFIGTRPDTVADEIYPLLEKLREKTYLSIELGLQSIHEKSLCFLNRNHTHQDFIKTFGKLKERGIDVIVHLIVGIPGETQDDMFSTVDEMNRLKPAGIKFHLFHVLRDTPLHERYIREPFPLLSREEYVGLVVSLLERLDPAIVIHRLTGERDREIFFAPSWALDKMRVLQAIQKRMADLDTFQGRSVKGTGVSPVSARFETRNRP
jgi:uncharacterized protein